MGKWTNHSTLDQPLDHSLIPFTPPIITRPSKPGPMPEPARPWRLCCSIHTYLLHHTSGLCFNSEMQRRRGPFAAHTDESHGPRDTGPSRRRSSVPWRPCFDVLVCPCRWVCTLRSIVFRVYERVYTDTHALQHTRPRVLSRNHRHDRRRHGHEHTQPGLGSQHGLPAPGF